METRSICIRQISNPPLQLWIGNNLCTTLTDMGAAQVETVKCDNPSHSVGRTVRIEVLDYLTLCEVKVFTKIEYEIGKLSVCFFFK